jgi:cytochrome c biogenesis factor
VRPEEAGQASGTTHTIRELGGVLGVAVLATVFTSNGSYASPQAYVDGMTSAVWVGAAVLALGAIAALFVPRRRRSVALATGRPQVEAAA